MEISASSFKKTKHPPTRAAIVPEKNARNQQRNVPNIYSKLKANADEIRIVDNTTRPIIVPARQDVPPLVNNCLWNTEPVYEFQFTSQTAYDRFVSLLEASFQDIDTRGKIIANPESQQIVIYYLPHILQRFIPARQMIDLIDQGVFNNNPGAHSNQMFLNDLRHNPYLVFHNHLSQQYEKSRNDYLDACTESWDSICKEQLKLPHRKMGHSKYPAHAKDFHKTVAAITSQPKEGILEGILLGATHGHQSAYRFLQENLAYLKNKGFNALFLKDIPYEMQSMLDEFYQSLPNREMSQELRRLLGKKHCALLELAKKVGIRIIGLGNRPHLNYLKAHHFIASEIIKRERGVGPYIALMEADSILCSPEPECVPGIGAYSKVTTLILADLMYFDKQDMNIPEFCILSGAEEHYSTAKGRNRYHREMQSHSNLNISAQPDCHVYIDVGPGANMDLESVEANQEKDLPENHTGNCIIS